MPSKLPNKRTIKNYQEMNVLCQFVENKLKKKKIKLSSASVDNLVMVEVYT